MVPTIAFHLNDVDAQNLREILSTVATGDRSPAWRAEAFRLYEKLGVARNAVAGDAGPASADEGKPA